MLNFTQWFCCGFTRPKNKSDTENLDRRWKQIDPAKASDTIQKNWDTTTKIIKVFSDFAQSSDMNVDIYAITKVLMGEKAIEELSKDIGEQLIFAINDVLSSNLPNGNIELDNNPQINFNFFEAKPSYFFKSNFYVNHEIAAFIKNLMRTGWSESHTKTKNKLLYLNQLFSSSKITCTKPPLASNTSLLKNGSGQVSEEGQLKQDELSLTVAAGTTESPLPIVEDLTRLLPEIVNEGLSEPGEASSENSEPDSGQECKNETGVAQIEVNDAEVNKNFADNCYSVPLIEDVAKKEYFDLAEILPVNAIEIELEEFAKALKHVEERIENAESLNANLEQAKSVENNSVIDLIELPEDNLPSFIAEENRKKYASKIQNFMCIVSNNLVTIRLKFINTLNNIDKFALGMGIKNDFVEAGYYYPKFFDSFITELENLKLELASFESQSVIDYYLFFSNIVLCFLDFITQIEEYLVAADDRVITYITEYLPYFSNERSLDDRNQILELSINELFVKQANIGNIKYSLQQKLNRHTQEKAKFIQEHETKHNEELNRLNTTCAQYEKSLAKAKSDLKPLLEKENKLIKEKQKIDKFIIATKFLAEDNENDFYNKLDKLIIERSKLEADFQKLNSDLAMILEESENLRSQLTKKLDQPTIDSVFKDKSKINQDELSKNFSIESLLAKNRSFQAQAEEIEGKKKVKQDMVLFCANKLEEINREIDDLATKFKTELDQEIKLLQVEINTKKGNILYLSTAFTAIEEMINSIKARYEQKVKSFDEEIAKHVKGRESINKNLEFIQKKITNYAHLIEKNKARVEKYYYYKLLDDRARELPTLTFCSNLSKQIFNLVQVVCESFTTEILQGKYITAAKEPERLFRITASYTIFQNIDCLIAKHYPQVTYMEEHFCIQGEMLYLQKRVKQLELEQLKTEQKIGYQELLNRLKPVQKQLREQISTCQESGQKIIIQNKINIIKVIDNNLEQLKKLQDELSYFNFKHKTVERQMVIKSSLNQVKQPDNTSDEARLDKLDIRQSELLTLELERQNLLETSLDPLELQSLELDKSVLEHLQSQRSKLEQLRTQQQTIGQEITNYMTQFNRFRINSASKAPITGYQEMPYLKKGQPPKPRMRDITQPKILKRRKRYVEIAEPVIAPRTDLPAPGY